MIPLQTVSFKTLGCRLNQSETDALETQFRKRGFRVRNFGDPVDLTVINTCTVTNDADRKSRSAIRQAIRRSKGGRVVVTGCYAQMSPGEIRQIAGVNLILGNQEKYKIFDYLDTLECSKLEEPLVFVNDSGFEIVSEEGFISSTSRTRAFLKIQDGCDYYCSFCIIPFARGPARSRPFEETVGEARRLIESGFREIILTGVNIGTYRDGLPGKRRDFADLVDVISQLEGLERLRISSIEPNTVSDKLLQLMGRSSVICPHLHIPLQSASDEILAAMQRKYRITRCETLIERFRKWVPHGSLGTDIIVGFPGETDTHFEETVAFLQKNQFSFVHTFSFSARAGTVATTLPQVVPSQIIQRRSQILHQVGMMLKKEFSQRFIGTIQPVLFEEGEESFETGLTPHYLRVRVPNASPLRYQIHPVKLKTVLEEGTLEGVLL